MKMLVIIQARTGSTRLPGKVLLPLGGKPLLQVMLQRVGAAREPMQVMVATTTSPQDDVIAELCDDLAVSCFRGDPTDLLARHYHAARQWDAEAVVKIPSDCPLIDPAVIDGVLAFYRRHVGFYDYVSNLHPASYPDGNDVEVTSMLALQQAYQQARLPMEREHTTPYLWDHPERFRIGNVAWETGLDYSLSHRWVIDYPEDYRLISSLYEALQPEHGDLFTLQHILDLLRHRPELRRINARYLGDCWYQKHLGELRTIDPGRAIPVSRAGTEEREGERYAER